MSFKGCVHIYTGDGKGKTTAAAGLAVRAAGSGMKVLFAQFLKGTPTGEIVPLQKIGITVIRTENVKKFIPYMTEQELEECRASQMNCFNTAKRMAPEFDMLVLDEIIGAVNTGMLDLNSVTEFIKQKPENLEIVMTGREPPSGLLELADYISEIKSVKHPYDKGLKARKGIEY